MPGRLRSTPGAPPDLAARFNVHWTPAVLIIDGDEKVQYRSVGHLPSADFIAMLAMGLGATAMNQRQYEDAQYWFEVVSREYGDAAAAPEAYYYSGALAYRAHGDMRVWQRLARIYPHSEWARKVAYLCRTAGENDE